jgi:hypothetical protein
MPKKYFICPDNEYIEIEDCMEKCRLGERCAPRPYLRMAGEDKRWNGRASVTMLGRCPRMYWLQERVDYAENPDRSAWKILGTRGHGKLEEYTEKADSAEEALDLDGLKGVTDLVEEENGEYILTDYKVIGSYAVAKMLGITEKGYRDVTDSEGNVEYYVRGPKKGQPKTEKVLEADPSRADVSNYKMQPNIYKLGWEYKNLGHQISKLYIFAIVRDGGLMVARRRGVERNTYMISIPIEPEAEVREWAYERRHELERVMNSDEKPRAGRSDETWNGNFCRNYCPVREHCRQMGGNPWLGQQIEF